MIHTVANLSMTFSGFPTPLPKLIFVYPFFPFRVFKSKCVAKTRYLQLSCIGLGKLSRLQTWPSPYLTYIPFPKPRIAR